MKKMTLHEVPVGGKFEYGGVELVKLEDDLDAAFVVAADTLPECCPFEDDDAEREDNNNYAGSLLSKAVERWLRDKHPAIFSAVVERPIDLTTMDGMTDYGKPLAVVRALTIDEYRKYRSILPLTSKPYWLATGWTTNSSPGSDARYAYFIRTVGTVYYNRVYYAYFAPRPALYLKSSILVSVETEDEEELTPEQKEMALYEGAVEKFGKRAQMLVAIEEMSELTKALLKYVRYEDFGQGDKESVLNSIAEERADVAIMLSQLEVIFGENAEVEWQKLEHLEKLVKGDV